jgi:hypothetical protein
LEGTGSNILTLKALRIINGQASTGGGFYITEDAIVTIELCVFSNCRATSSSVGGGAIYVQGAGTTINAYGTSFNGNAAGLGNGDDIYRDSDWGSPTITIHNTCPSPYSSNTPTQGKTKMRSV